MFRLENKYIDTEDSDETELSDEQCLDAIRKYEENEYEIRHGSPSFWKEEGTVLYEISEADYYELLAFGEVKLYKYP